MKLTKQISVLIGILTFFPIHAQIKINNMEEKNVEKLLLDEFIGSGVEISNATLNGSKIVKKGIGKQIATYESGSECGMLNIQKGLILSTDNISNTISDNLAFQFGNETLNAEELNEFINGFLKEQYQKTIEQYGIYYSYYRDYNTYSETYGEEYSSIYPFSEDEFNTLMDLMDNNPYFMSGQTYYNLTSTYTSVYSPEEYNTYSIYNVIKSWNPAYYTVGQEVLEDVKDYLKGNLFTGHANSYYINTPPVPYSASKAALYEKLAKGLLYKNTQNKLKDKELQNLTNAKVNAPAILEFDFTTIDDSIAFNYVFASQEYPDYVGTQYNDAFAFIITDLTTDTKENIAKVPNTNTYVSINNINQLKNNEYFIPNYQKNDKNQPIYEDCNTIKVGGFTTTLTAKCKVVPCRKYHLKMAVGNVSDYNLQSMVFLEAGSFKSNGVSSKTRYSRANAHGIANECSNGEVVLQIKDSDTPTKIKISHIGKAKNGIDYQKIPEEVIIPAHQDSVVFELKPLHDIEEDSLEIVMAIESENSCSSSQGDTIRSYIFKSSNISITPIKAECCATELSVEHTGPIRKIKWEPANLLQESDDFTVHPINCPENKQVFKITAESVFGCQTAEGTLVLNPCDKSVEITTELITEDGSSDLIAACNNGKVVFHITRGKDAVGPTKIKLTYPSDMNLEGLPEELTIPEEENTFEVPVKAKDSDTPYRNTFNVTAECENSTNGPVTLEITTTQLEKLELGQDNTFSGCEVKGMALNVPLVSGKLGKVTWAPADKLTSTDQLSTTLADDIEAQATFNVTATDDRGCQTATATVTVEKEECLEMTAELVTENNGNELIADCKDGKVVFHISRNREGNKEAIIKINLGNDANLSGLPETLTIPAAATTFEVPVKAAKLGQPYHNTFNVVAECENCISAPVSFEVITTELEKLELEQNNTFTGCEVKGMALNVPLVSGKLGEVTWKPAEKLTSTDQLSTTLAEDIEAQATFNVTATDERGCQTATANVTVEKEECLEMTAELVTENNGNELIADCKDGKVVFHISRNREGNKEAIIKINLGNDANLSGLPETLTIPAAATTFEVPVKAAKLGQPYHNTFNVVAECENCISAPVSFEVITTELEKLELEQNNTFTGCEVKGMALNVPLVSGKLGEVTWKPAEKLTSTDQLSTTLAEDIEAQATFNVTATDERGCQTATANVTVEKEECLEMTAELVTENNGNELIADCKDGKVVFHISRNRKGNKKPSIKLSFGSDANLSGLPETLTIPAGASTFEVPVKAAKLGQPYRNTFNVLAECENCISAPVSFEVTTTELEKLELEQNNTFTGCEVKGMALNVPLVSGKLGEVIWKPADKLTDTDLLNATLAEDIDAQANFTLTATDDRGCQTATATVTVIKEECLEMTAELVTDNNGNELIADCKEGKVVFHINRNRKGSKKPSIKLNFGNDANLIGLPETLTIPAGASSFEVPVKAAKADEPYRNTFNIVAECENCISEPVSFEVTTTQLEKLELGQENTFTGCDVKGMALNVPLVSGKLGNVTWDPADKLTDTDLLNATLAEDIEAHAIFNVTATDDRGCQTAKAKVSVVKEECLEMTAELVTDNNGNELITDCKEGKIVIHINRNRKGDKKAVVKLKIAEGDNLYGLPEEVTIPAGDAIFEIPVKAEKTDTAYSNTFSVEAECENCISEPVTFEVTTTQLEPLVLSQNNVYNECEVGGMDIEVGLLSGTLGEVTWSPDQHLASTNNLSATLSDDIKSNIEYTVTATDPTGCQKAKSTVKVKQRLCIDLVIPPYFTPNGDGISDVWKVYGLEKTENSKVEIFDRWGKLLFEFNPNSSGWDGTYNGELCPSSDYWYVIDCEEIDKEYTGHFTLLR